MVPESMREQAFEIELLSDAVISRHSATEGGHVSLDYVPGSCLLGAAAASLYANWEACGDAFVAFHSGRVRFGNAYPRSAAGQPLLPAPLSWHHEKGCSAVAASGQSLRPGALQNLAAEPWAKERTQPKRLRAGWFDPDSGEWWTAQRTHRMKTAISSDPEDFGAAAEGALFGYEAIAAGTHLAGSLWADADVPDRIWEGVLGALLDREIVVGRSRSAEFGLARVRRREASRQVRGCAPRSGAVIIYACSDLALRDGAGFALRTPTAAALGLAGAGELLPGRSFLRTRAYTPWNAKRRGPDLERHVILKGSVLVFERGALDGSEPRRWAGSCQHDGLGELWVDPEFLVVPLPEFSGTARIAQAESAEAVARPARLGPRDRELVEVCTRRFRERQLQERAVAQGRIWGQRWAAHRSQPSAAQWARLREAAIRARSRAELIRALDPGHAEAAPLEAGSLGKGLFTDGVSQRRWAPLHGRRLCDSILGDLLEELGVGDLLDEAETSPAEAAAVREALVLAACREASVYAARDPRRSDA